MPPRSRNTVPAEVAASSPLSAIAVFAHALWRKQAHGLVVVAANETRAEELGRILYALDPDCDPMVLPRSDFLPYEKSTPSPEVSGRRASVLLRLAAGLSRPLLVATPDALLLRLPPPKVWTNAGRTLRAEAAMDVDELRAFLERAGYVSDARVDAPGEMAINGQTVDLYPAGALGPVRIVLEEGRIASIKAFDPETQQTSDDVAEVAIGPVSETVFGAIENEDKGAHDDASIFNYLPATVDVLEDAGAQRRADAWFDGVHDAFESARSVRALRSVGTPLIEPERLFMSRDAWRPALAQRSVEQLDAREAEPVRPPNFATQGARSTRLRDFVDDAQGRGHRVIFAAATDRDLAAVLRRARQDKADAVECAGWDDVLGLKRGKVGTLRADFDAGFVFDSLDLTAIAAADVLGSRARHDTPFGWRDARLGGIYESVAPGDAVVHLARGVCRLDGLETLPDGVGVSREAVRLTFAGDASVLVPIEELAQIWKHGDRAGLKLDKADGSSWEKRKADVEAAIDATAEKLVAAAAERARAVAPKLVPPAAQYERFAAGFPYFLTPDQADAIADVLADLASGHPMDRLICGDVGFGKTEVALRAAAAAVFAGKQVALAAPTTVLARQHVETFRRRFAGSGIEVGHLSRFASASEARATKKKLADGSLRLVIGTHTLAAKGVRFADLGLVIIDEEQRFGAADKAKLRARAEGAHLLTLTATPIPRTLEGALAGLKSVSVVATPPARRVPVRTVVRPYDADTLAEALRHERRRGGQSFVVCPRIEDIPQWQERLRQLVPGFEVEVVHGKMPTDEIDSAMLRFADGEADVLLATNIIESGLDVPRANTIVLLRPDRFGLAQLHQLRGRVGRGARRGYAYLLTDPQLAQTPASRKRLAALEEFSALGAGFDISRRDLEIRGAGDLFGAEQTGHIDLVGPQLYRHLLDQAIGRARDKDVGPTQPPDLHLGVGGALPPDYVASPEARLELYQRLTRLSDEAEIEQFADELIDRFGPPPPEAERLLDLARLRVACVAKGVARLDAGPRAVAVTPLNGRLNPPKGGDVQWRKSEDRLVADIASDDDARLEAAARALASLG